MNQELEIKMEGGENTAKVTSQKSYFDVLGICCPSEVPLIERILRHVDGVHKVTVIVPSKTVIVEHDPHLISQLQIGIHFFSPSYLYSQIYFTYNYFVEYIGDLS